ncbi:MAG: GTPase Era [Candidatus Eisenbacteria bacterium]|nr:GTPase Era [Candidatus Eisenbacteria bacterium]
MSDQEPEGVPSDVRCGYVALVGEPNVGKSTLMNKFLEEKIAIVTSKPQTTRRKTLGILNGPGYQMILLDTPGIMEPRYDLHRAMIKEAEQALAEADVVLHLVEPVVPKEVLPAIRAARGRRVLAVNKVDLLRRKEDLLPVLQAYHESGLFEELVPLSALSGEGVHELLRVLVAALPLGVPFYPPEQIATQPERFFVGEIVRERIFIHYREEVPYATEVEVTEFKERDGAKDFIEAVILVENESQKRILIGKAGAAIKQLGEDARLAIELFLDRGVFLSLRVKVAPKWRRREAALRRLGYSS